MMMVNRSFHAIVLVLAASMVAFCQEKSDPKSLVMKGLTAHGGREKISQKRAGVLKVRDKANDVEITGVEWFELPDRWKKLSIAESKGLKAYTLMIEGNLWEWDEGQQARQTEKSEVSRPAGT